MMKFADVEWLFKKAKWVNAKEWIQIMYSREMFVIRNNKLIIIGFIHFTLYTVKSFHCTKYSTASQKGNKGWWQLNTIRWKRHITLDYY